MANKVTDIDRGYGQFLSAMSRLTTRRYVVVGVRKGSKGRGGVDLATIAAVHEFGSTDGRIPERSFIRSTYDRKIAGYTAKVAVGLGKAVLGLTSADEVLDDLGRTMAADVVATIDAGIAPPNAPSTLRRKNGTKPLVDTGALRAAISHEVRKA